MKNQIFDSNRFISYFRKCVIERRTTLLNLYGIPLLFAIVFCIGLPFVNGYYNTADLSGTTGGNVIDPMWRKEIFFFIILWIVSGVFCCDFFAPLQKKTSRISLFTCPASNLEKFLTFFLCYAVFVPIITFVGMLFADALRVWIYSGSSPLVHYISPEYLLTFGTDQEYYITNFIYQIEGSTTLPASTLHFIKVRCLVKYLMILFTGLFVQALYTLGSTVWPVKCAPKTTGFLLGMLIICGNLFYYGVKLFYPHTAITPRESGLEDMTVILLVSLTVLAFIIFIWWVAYTRFKEWEVVKRW